MHAENPAYSSSPYFDISQVAQLQIRLYHQLAPAPYQRQHQANCELKHIKHKRHKGHKEKKN
jgi:hypothetical protein